MKRPILALFLGLLLPALPPAASAQDTIREVTLAFPAGATGTQVTDTVTGYDSVSYYLGAEAGQHMTISLAASNNQTYFTVYAPGQAPGGGGLAGSDMPGPMVPDLNRFDADLPSSGTYTVNVYQMRNAARQGMSARYTLDVSITGATGAIVQGDYADGLAGGPDYFAIRTATPGGSLNIRAEASTGAAILATLPNGAVLRNLGCRMNEGRRWCRVATLADPGIDGWAAGEHLIEGAAPDGGVVTQLPDRIPVASNEDALVPGTDFHATGQIDCQHGAEPAAACDFGVVREGGGSGWVTVTLAWGGTRLIRFENGAAVDFDRSQADGGTELTAIREQDNSVVTIGQDRFTIPDAVIYGG